MKTLIKKTSQNDLEDHIISLGLRKGSNVIIHSNLISFGKIDFEVQVFYETIKKILGKESTIVIPSYTMNIDEFMPFDTRKTYPYAMGAIPNLLMNKKEVNRTSNPIHSHFIEGPLKFELLCTNPYISFGKESIFEVLHSLNFELVLLGCTFQKGATFVHHVEAIKGVKYRKWINLKRKIKNQKGVTENINIKYYAIKKELGLKTDLSILQKKLTDIGINRSVKNNYGSSNLISLKDLYKYTYDFLSKDPFILVTKSI